MYGSASTSDAYRGACPCLHTMKQPHICGEAWHAPLELEHGLSEGAGQWLRVCFMQQGRLHSKPACSHRRAETHRSVTLDTHCRKASTIGGRGCTHRHTTAEAVHWSPIAVSLVPILAWLADLCEQATFLRLERDSAAGSSSTAELGHPCRPAPVLHPRNKATGLPDSRPVG